HIPFPAHRLHAARGNHFHRRCAAARGDGRHRRSARAGAGRLGFPYSTLKETRFSTMFIFNANQLNINAVLEVMMAADFGRFRLPSRSEFFLEDHKMRIAHGYRSAFDLTKSQLDKKRFADLRLAHVGLKAEALAFASVQ